MPTLNPRITVTLTPEASSVLRELSKLTGNSQSAIVGDLVATSAPVFERVCSALRAASIAQESARSEIVAGLERAQDKLEAQLGLKLEPIPDAAPRPLLDEAEKIGRRAGREYSNPVPVTRGSGPENRSQTLAQGRSRSRTNRPKKRARS